MKAETWEAINRKLVLQAAENGVESGEKVRTDCTVVASNIHSPTDSTLLRDCVRVLARLMGDAAEDFGLSFRLGFRQIRSYEKESGARPTRDSGTGARAQPEVRMSGEERKG